MSMKAGVDTTSPHRKPVSTLQLASQPSPGFLLPSSHSSLPTWMPSPQATLGVPSAANVGSFWHTPLQPSPYTALPSSQPSSASLPFLPQMALVQAVPGAPLQT